MPFERSSFVSICTTFKMVCISRVPEVQNFQNMSTTQLHYFLRYLKTFSHSKELHQHLYCFSNRSYLVCSFGSTACSKYINKLSIRTFIVYRGIGELPMPFERASLAPICTAFQIVCTSKGSEIQNFQNISKEQLRCFLRYRKTANTIQKIK